MFLERNSIFILYITCKRIEKGLIVFIDKHNNTTPRFFSGCIDYIFKAYFVTTRGC